MLFWHLPLLSVILADPHHAVLTKIRQKRAVFDVLPTIRPDRKCRSKSEQKTNKAGASEEDKVNPESEGGGKGRICAKDKVGRGRHVLKRMAAFMERRRKEAARSSKEIKNILRRMVFEQALKKKSRRQEKHELKEDEVQASVNLKQIPKKATKKKAPLVKDLILGGLNVLELFLRIG